MKYKAIIVYETSRMFAEFETIGAAERWLDTNNENQEYISFIQEVDNEGNVLDWFYYTEKGR